METTGKAELGPSHNSGKPPSPLRGSFLFAPQPQTPLLFPTWCLPMTCPTQTSPGLPRLNPQILRSSVFTPNLLFLLFSLAGTPVPSHPILTQPPTGHDPPQAPFPDLHTQLLSGLPASRPASTLSLGRGLLKLQTCLPAQRRSMAPQCP